MLIKIPKDNASYDLKSNCVFLHEINLKLLCKKIKKN